MHNFPNWFKKLSLKLKYGFEWCKTPNWCTICLYSFAYRLKNVPFWPKSDIWFIEEFVPRFLNASFSPTVSVFYMFLKWHFWRENFQLSRNISRQFQALLVYKTIIYRWPISDLFKLTSIFRAEQYVSRRFIIAYITVLSSIIRRLYSQRTNLRSDIFESYRWIWLI